MKKKFFYFLCTLTLILPCAFIFAACGESEVYHEHNSWDSCPECNEIIHLAQHNFVFEGYNDILELDVYRCSTCDYVSNQLHKHVFNKYKITPSYHWDICGSCGYESSSNGVHQYGTLADGWTSNCKFENGVAKCKCVDCGHEKTVELITFEDSLNGSVEILYNNNNNYIVKPVANDGYYFTKWLIHKEEYNGKSLILDELGTNDTESIQPIISVEPRLFDDSFWTYNLKPVFATTQPTFSDIDVVLNVENNIDVDIEYMFYNNAHGTQISYYLPENNDVVLKKISTEHAGENYNNTTTVYNSTNYDGSLTLPVNSSCGANSTLGQCKKVTFEFKDVKNSYFAKAKYEINGVTYDMSVDSDINKTETFVSNAKGIVTIEKGVEKIQEANNFHYYYVDKWVDELGNIVSNNKKFTTQLNENKVFTAIMKQADEIYEENDVVYLFSQNEDESLTLEGLYSVNTAGNIIIPDMVNEKNVTAIGDNAFIPNHLNSYGRYVSSITVPERVVNFDKTAFNDVGICDITINGNKDNLTFEMFKNSKFSIYSSIYNLAAGNDINVSSYTLNSMIQKLVKTFVDVKIEVELVDSEHLGNEILGHYESGTKKICLLQTEGYSFATLSVIAYELRHFYQEVAIGNVSELTTNDLKISPSENQIGAWKYLDYADPDENNDAYWFNAREIDAREFSANLMGCQIFVR